MTNGSDIRSNARGALFSRLDDVRAGMLGVAKSGQRMQPMTHFPEADAGVIWFLTGLDTDLVRAIGNGGRAQYCLIGKDQDFYACMTGEIARSEDRDKLSELWSPVAEAWFPQGIDDPQVCLLRLTLQTAAIWTTTSSTLVFGLEVVRANLSADHDPDLGDHVIVRFDAAA